MILHYVNVEFIAKGSSAMKMMKNTASSFIMARIVVEGELMGGYTSDRASETVDFVTDAIEVCG
jgi:hypothetical protein